MWNTCHTGKGSDCSVLTRKFWYIRGFIFLFYPIPLLHEVEGKPTGVNSIMTVYLKHLSRKPQYKDVHRGTIEMPQGAHTFKVNCCLKVHNAHLKLLTPISGYGDTS